MKFTAQRRQFSLALPAFATAPARPSPPSSNVCPKKCSPKVLKLSTGMSALRLALISKILEPVEYPVEFVFPRPATPPGEPLTLRFPPFDRSPVTASRSEYESSHETILFHHFYRSRILPTTIGHGSMRHLPTALPFPAGTLQVFADFYP